MDFDSRSSLIIKRHPSFEDSRALDFFVKGYTKAHLQFANVDANRFQVSVQSLPEGQGIVTFLLFEERTQDFHRKSSERPVS